MARLLLLIDKVVRDFAAGLFRNCCRNVKITFGTSFRHFPFLFVACDQGLIWGLMVLLFNQKPLNKMLAATTVIALP
jgi:hypothetical protein